MKAVIWSEYGSPDRLCLVEMERPVPKENEVLVKIHASSVTIGDSKVRRADPFFVRFYFGLIKPRRINILGMEFAGEIEAVGREVERFKKGDEVFGSSFPGLKFGAHAQYICLPEDGVLAVKPENLTFEEAAAGISSGGLTALNLLRDKGKVQNGRKVLVYGASGSVGTYAVQLAKHFGAEVTGVCSTANLEMVKSLGADRVIDYTKDDFMQGEERYDLILDAVEKISKSRCRNSLKPGGEFISVAAASSKEMQANLDLLAGLAGEGKILPVIDRTYPLEQIAEAHRYVDQGHKRGNVIVTVDHIGGKK